jgi:hypothetical protein
MPYDDVNQEFLNYLVEEVRNQQAIHGSMTKVYYNKFYLEQEAINRLMKFNRIKSTHKAQALKELVKAAASIMGCYSRETGYGN